MASPHGDGTNLGPLMSIGMSTLTSGVIANASETFFAYFFYTFAYVLANLLDGLAGVVKGLSNGLYNTLTTSYTWETEILTLMILSVNQLRRCNFERRLRPVEVNP